MARKYPDRSAAVSAPDEGERVNYWLPPRDPRCSIPSSCLRMMAGMVADSSAEMRRYVDDKIAEAMRGMEAVADRAAARAADDVMRRFNETVFGTEKPSVDEISRLHQMQSIHRWLVNALLMTLGVTALWLVVDRIIERGDQIADTARERIGVHQEPRQ